MGLRTLIKNRISSLTGFWIYKKSELPTGTSLLEDINFKINLPLHTIMDVGANIGQTALNFSKDFPQAKILSFEPFNSTYQELKKNTAHLNNVTCFNLAFSNKSESIEVKLFDKEQSVLNSLITDSMNNAVNAKTETILTDTIDEFLSKNAEINSIDLLKIDTEGFEIPILEGAKKSLLNKKIKLIYVEVGFSRTNNRNSYFLDIQNYLEQNNFTFFGFYEICNIDIKYKIHFGNALYIHNDHLKHIKGVYS